ncbi:CaiB/BaiF CoA transferase family protein [Nocardioides sp. Iso805N]|uniref:CaiB/BaiF CoA transferase family protein n=1 Tax=Nocardioides sp. Iso805N TaxID=1283287 RepID=UPI00037BCF3C|nr:CoA transferase [Nocardioides sp. Iso805N]
MDPLIPTGDRPGSLHGLRVIEISTSVAGPMAAMILGDLGAEVVKVERVGAGDDTRSWNPPAWNGVSTAFLGLNRNKRSLELDYKTPQGKQILEELVRSADVLIQNLRPGAIEAAGFGWERLQELNSRLVYVEMTGFGPLGPMADEPAYDPVVQAYSGIVAMMPQGEDGPTRVPLSILDKGTGMWAAIGALDALRRREQTGTGSLVNVSLLNTALDWVGGSIMNASAGNKREKLGSGFPGMVPYGAFPARDGHVFISAGNQKLWLQLVAAVGAPELNDRAGFGSNGDRSANRAEVEAAVAGVTSRFGRDELSELLTAARVPNAAIRAAAELPSDPQVQAIGGIRAMPHPQIPEFATVALPIQIDGALLPLQGAPPLLGADSAAILASLGYGEDEVDRLLAEGVVGATEVPASVAG